MEPTDLTVKILVEIRDSIRETNGRVDSTNSRLDQTNSRLDQTNAKLDETRVDLGQRMDLLTDRVVEAEIRTATAITALAGSIDSVKNLFRDRLDLRDRMDRCEVDISALKERAGLR